MSEEVVKIRKKLEEHEERISKLEKLLQTKKEVMKKRLSIKEFILQKKPRNDVQRALAISYYLENYEGFSCFNSKDIGKGFREAREKVPTNVADKIQQSIAKGYMMKADEEKDGKIAYVLTNTGVRFIESGFTKEE